MNEKLKKIVKNIPQELVKKYYQINKQKSEKIGQVIIRQDKEKKKKILDSIKD